MRADLSVMAKRRRAQIKMIGAEADALSCMNGCCETARLIMHGGAS